MSRLKYNLNGPAKVGDDLEFVKGTVHPISPELAAEIARDEARWKQKGFELLPDIEPLAEP